jgi:ABC-type taurine transport system ATPase subunit
MLTKLTLRNFKRFEQAEIELGNPVVFIGPNDSGKTTALQAVALWHIGLRRWAEKRRGRTAPEKRPGVTINRRDLIAVPVPDANLLWRDLHVRDIRRTPNGQETRNIRVDVIVEGVTGERFWKCGLEFDYANEESFYCRPLRTSERSNPDRMPIPDEAMRLSVAFLPPMSGLAANETRLDPGAINVRIGEGRTAEVLRNLCYQLLTGEGGQAAWDGVRQRIRAQFGIELEEPIYIAERGEITMTYRTPAGVRLDLSSSGRGLQQTLLLLAHLQVNRGAVLLLDEPDAHLEILRQREIYQLLTEAAREHESQIIAASHSEVVLIEAADRDVVVAFVGRPHRIDDRGSQLLKALKEIGFDQYYQAEQTGWVLYLEGSTDLAILRAFARTLAHPAQAALERPFVHYAANQQGKARDHFHGLREAKPDLVGFALFDRLERPPESGSGFTARMWRKREIENYLCRPEVLHMWALREAEAQGPLFAQQWVEAMETAIQTVETARAALGQASPWSDDVKASDEALKPLFENFYKELQLPNLMDKSDYHRLAEHVQQDGIDPEVVQVLDTICAVAESARPVV